MAIRSFVRTQRPVKWVLKGLTSACWRVAAVIGFRQAALAAALENIRKESQPIVAFDGLFVGVTSEPDSNTLIGFKLYLSLKRLATVLFVKIEINSIIPMGILRL